MLRAKFSVYSIVPGRTWWNDPETGKGEEKPSEMVSLTAVGGGPKSENAKWAAASPSGNLTLTIVNPRAQGVFKLGKSYFLDFTEATD